MDRKSKGVTRITRKKEKPRITQNKKSPHARSVIQSFRVIRGFSSFRVIRVTILACKANQTGDVNSVNVTVDTTVLPPREIAVHDIVPVWPPPSSDESGAHTPEPATIALLGTGLAGGAAAR
jgi:hypothetical protein